MSATHGRRGISPSSLGRPWHRGATPICPLRELEWEVWRWDVGPSPARGHGAGGDRGLPQPPAASAASSCCCSREGISAGGPYSLSGLYFYRLSRAPLAQSSFSFLYFQSVSRSPGCLRRSHTRELCDRWLALTSPSLMRRCRFVAYGWPAAPVCPAAGTAGCRLLYHRVGIAISKRLMLSSGATGERKGMWVQKSGG